MRADIHVPVLGRERVILAFEAAGLASPVNSDVSENEGALYLLGSASGLVRIGHTFYDARGRMLVHSKDYGSLVGPLFAIGCCSASRREERAFHAANRRWATDPGGGRGRRPGSPSRSEWYRADSPIADAVNLIDHQLRGTGSVVVARPAPRISFRGERLSVWRWGRRFGTTEQAICDRLRKGWTLEEALTTPGGSTQRKAA
jgi:hypothetical protein